MTKKNTNFYLRFTAGLILASYLLITASASLHTHYFNYYSSKVVVDAESVTKNKVDYQYHACQFYNNIVPSYIEFTKSSLDNIVCLFIFFDTDSPSKKSTHTLLSKLRAPPAIS